MAKAIGIVGNGAISPFPTIQALLDVSLNFAFFKKAKSKCKVFETLSSKTLHLDNSKMPCMSLAAGILGLFSGH